MNEGGRPADRWVVCQIGAREHYALARGLFRRRKLAALITDAWSGDSRYWGALPGQAARRLADRAHGDLKDAPVHEFTLPLIALEAKFRLFRTSQWDRIIQRNDWFQRRAVEVLERQKLLDGGPAHPRIVLAYSYAARRIFEFARNKGCITVLCQIDPGPKGEEVVARAASNAPMLAGKYAKAHAEYWHGWRQECAAAHHIVVNSEWSRDALRAEGVPEAKIVVIPLSFQTAIPCQARRYPDRFHAERPLRVLFVGTCGIGKGLAALIDAIRLLQDRPVEFWLVGSCEVQVPQDILHNPRIHFVGAVPRSETRRFYEMADVFLFPTLSDGFGMVQIEAQAAGLPVIASRHCGRVVVEGANGLLLSEVSGGAIAGRLKWCLEHPRELTAMSVAGLGMNGRFSEDAVINQFLALPLAEGVA